ncbi:MAG: PhzF family phenazine biosynthesis protein, partial [Clostridia bacterium]|nr:PhzF family phenazine biosynthesis protein [Clostridia bacterium]
KPDFKLMKELSGLAVAVSAKAKDYDCISRVFAPELAIAEDPVTGSTHCMIAPYWAKKYGKNHIKAFQASERTGELFCEVCDGCNKVKISGKAVLFGISDILI